MQFSIPSRITASPVAAVQPRGFLARPHGPGYDAPSMPRPLVFVLVLSDLRSIKGAKSGDIMSLLGHSYGEEAIHRNNMVVL